MFRTQRRLFPLTSLTAEKSARRNWTVNCRFLLTSLSSSLRNSTPKSILCFVHRYDERIDRVETRITARLRDQLGIARNANEMFRIFSRYNALFVRPHIRGAIREYQAQLIQRVKDDIESLHEKFKVLFPYSFPLTLSLPIPLRLYTLPYWSKTPVLIFDIRALWLSGLSARAPECQKSKLVF